MRGLYVHIPFCVQKCPYCSFYSETKFDKELINKYFEACLNDISNAENKNFDTIYFGGGTPSAVSADILDKFTNKLLKIINYSSAEFTIEANPESVNDSFCNYIKDNQITRVSLGVQSFDDNTLKLLGRIHGADKALKSAEMLKTLDVGLNLDMIFDIPNISKQSIFDTATKITSFSPSHVSAYAYSSEDRGYLKGFCEDETQFEEIESFFESHGLKKYETSNFAKIGHESKHNKIYWQMDEYIGIGSSSHSMIYMDGGRYKRFSKVKDLNKYILNPLINDEDEISDSETGVKESIILGLRMKNGVDIEIIKKRFGKIEINLINSIDNYLETGLLIWEGSKLKTTKRGALVLESLSLSLWAS